MITKYLGDGTQTDLEAIVLSLLKSPKHLIEICAVVGMNQMVVKPVLSSLVEKGLACKLTDNHYKALKRGVDYGGYADSEKVVK